MNQQDILANRIHPALNARKADLERNLLCIGGGSPYISERLSKFPCETSLEFKSRKSKAYLTNYAARSVHKINQHVFQRQPERVGIDEGFFADVSKTADQTTLQELIVEASTYLSVAGWCWARVDRSPALVDADGLPIDQSLADKEARGDRPYISLYSPLAVIDWSFSDKTGKLEWLLTEEVSVNRPNPFSSYQQQHTRTLWLPRVAKTYLIETQEVTGERSSTLISSTEYDYNGVPFVLLGKPTASPIIFDDIEKIQASLLNIESSHSYSIWRSHYNTMVLPEGVIRDMTEAYEIDYAQAAGLIISEGRAIVENVDDKGITRFVAPEAASAETRRAEVDAMKAAMFEVFGLYMRRSGAQVESAEAKAWDYKDVSAFMKERAEILQRFEEKLVKLCMEIDPLFKEYTPVYSKDFDLVDSQVAMNNVILALQLGLPESSEKYLKAVAVDIVEGESGQKLTPTQKRELMEDIETQEKAQIQQLEELG